MLLGFLTLIASQAHAAWREYNLAVPSARAGVKQPFVLAAGEGVPVTHVIVYFTGGGGEVLAAREGLLTREATGLSIRGFLAEKFGAVAFPTIPMGDKSLADGIGMSFRETPEHVADSLAVVDAVRKMSPGAKVIIAGLSNGAVSAINLAANIRKDVAGVVILSGGINAFRSDWLDNLKDVPMLVIHHKRDSCILYRDTESVAKFYHFVSVENTSKPRAGNQADCGPGSAHIFDGQIEQVLNAVGEWISTGKTATEIR